MVKIEIFHKACIGKKSQLKYSATNHFKNDLLFHDVIP